MQDGLKEAAPARKRFARTRLQEEGQVIRSGAYVVAAMALGDRVITAHGDGRLRVFQGDAVPREIGAHRGAVLAMAADSQSSVITGGDDGRLLRVGVDGAVEELADFGSSWVDCVAAHSGAGLRACSVRKVVHVWRDDGEYETLEHPSTAGGLAFDTQGQRLAVAHYGGATLWERGAQGWESRSLEWAGSHIGITWSPDGEFVVTIMQENALHGWRLRDNAHMRMSGYPTKPRAMRWAGETPHLVTAGADQVVCWPFDAAGPMGRVPLCVAHGGEQMATEVLDLPGQPAVLAGFQDGAVLLSELADKTQTIVVRGSTGVEVTAMAIPSSLSHVLIGDAVGDVLWAPLGQGDADATAGDG